MGSSLRLFIGGFGRLWDESFHLCQWHLDLLATVNALNSVVLLVLLLSFSHDLDHVVAGQVE